MPAEAFPRSALAPRGGQRGVTLVELIVALVVLGALLPLVSMFVRDQIEGYTDVVRRAELVDIADSASRRMARDLQRALPNSVRTPDTSCVEFIPTRAGGRYRLEKDAGGAGDPLDFSAEDTAFDLFGDNPDIAVGDLVAVYNLGIPGAADAYDLSPATSTVANVTAIEAGDLSGETKLRIGKKEFPLASPSNRFHVIPGAEQVVSYVCIGPDDLLHGNGQKTLYRQVRSLPYPKPGACPAAAAGAAILATNVARCEFVYSEGFLQRMGLVSISLEITRAHETIRLHRQVNVTNTP